MKERYLLPGRTIPPVADRLARLRVWLLQRWSGRILLAALGIKLLAEIGLPLPGLLTVPATLIVWLYGIYWGFRLARFLLRKLLWRIRNKLLVSYLFIAVVPLVLLALFFVLAGVLFAGLAASHMVTTEMERTGQSLLHVAQAALTALPAEDAQAMAGLTARLDAARKIHPDLEYALVRHGRALAKSGDVPETLPAWWKGPGFIGLVKHGRDSAILRALWTRSDGFLLLQVPVDSKLLAEFEQRMGIHLLSVGGRAEQNRGITIDLGPDKGKDPKQPAQQIIGFPFFTLPERTDWATGKVEQFPLTFQFQPYDFARRLSPGGIQAADLLVHVLAIVGVVFLVMYSVALLVGLLLVRSVTRSVHALSVGTVKVREGDFGHAILVRSRDQLGELAESFNMMARGIQDLLREQAEKQRLEEELRIARQIQMSLLPQGTVTLPGLRIAALCLPAAEVGGDYYDLLPLAPTRMGVLIADVSGKGTSAALYMAELKGLVLSLSRIYESPAKLLCEANRILASTMDPRSFITMTYAVVDTAARSMRYARAGHNPIIQFEATTGRTRVLTPQGLGLGIDPGLRFEEILEEAEVPLAIGDTFVFFTDGLSEAMNGRAELFGERRLRDLVEASESLGSEELKQRILDEIRGFVGDAAQHDDMTLVILKVV
jgi:sigma-B regulation protein RsbU (phosphoserine phosphatase)